MNRESRSSRPLRQLALLCGAVALAAGGVVYSSLADSQSQTAADSSATSVSPIKHVIVIVGENRTFDHVFGAYQPRHGETVSNLLSKGIITADGAPGPNFWLAVQYTANATDPSRFEPSPGSKKPYSVLPAPVLRAASTQHGIRTDRRERR
jgi:phospholipase C